MKVKLICFPYAGGNKNCYNKYLRFKNSDLAISAIEYSGRGSRISEKLKCEIDSVVSDALKQCLSLLDGTLFALYGHSMGGLIAYLVTRLLVEKNIAPVHLFISGRRAPSVLYEENLHKLERPELISKLKEFGGSNHELLQDPVIMDIYEPIIKSDFEAIASYQYQKQEKIPVPITIITGNADTISYEQLSAWQAETTEALKIEFMNGGHFFIFDNASEIMSLINNTLCTIESNFNH
jgi:surfactin synthase thioesterase subunit